MADQVLFGKRFKTQEQQQYDLKDDFPEVTELANLQSSLAKWITAYQKGLYVDPEACNSISQIHVILRQLKVVIRRLRSKVEELNNEIKKFTNIREDLTISIWEVDQGIIFRKSKTLVTRPRCVKNPINELSLRLHERDGKALICQENFLESQRILKVQFLKVKQQLLDLGKLRERIQTEITRLSNCLQKIPGNRVLTQKIRQEEFLRTKYIEFIKKERLQKMGLMPFPVEYPEKQRSIHYKADLPIHKRYERKKEMHPVELGDPFLKKPKMFALATGDSFKAMSAMAGASLCSIDRACNETIKLRLNIIDAIEVALVVEPTRHRTKILYGRPSFGLEYGIACNGRRGRRDPHKVIHGINEGIFKLY